MAVAASYFGDLDRTQSPAAGGGDLDSPSDQAQQPRSHPGFENQVRAGIGQYDAGDSALPAQVWRPAAAARGLVDQPAFLAVPPALEVLEVVGAFASRRCAHSRIWGEGATPG